MLNQLPDYFSNLQSIDLTGRTRVIVAVSGGGDSLALLFVLHDYVKRHAKLDIELLAVTVDHNLRLESAAEAEQVAGLCAQHGIEHRTMRWEVSKPSSGISEAAREARQDLLAKAAIDAGCDLVMLAHTKDDQAETTHMRMSRANGRGLAGIAPATLYNRRIWFVRPLLDAKRSDLRAYLTQRSIPWIDDPTNTDIRYERARVRQSLTQQDGENLLEISTTTAGERERHGYATAQFIEQHVRLCSPGLLRFPKTAFQGLEAATAIDLLRIMLAIAGGASHLPDQDGASELLTRMMKSGTRATLSRAVISAHREYFYLHREFRNIPSQPVRDGLMWDRRYQVSASRIENDILLAPVGLEQAQLFDWTSIGLPNSIARQAFAAEPALWQRGVQLTDSEVRSKHGITWTPIMGPWARLVPSFDYAPAAAMSAVLGIGNLPKRPWRCHKQQGNNHIHLESGFGHRR